MNKVTCEQVSQACWRHWAQKKWNQGVTS